MSEKSIREKALKLIADGEDDEVIRILTGYPPAVIQTLRREAVCNMLESGKEDSSHTEPDIQGGLF